MLKDLQIGWTIGKIGTPWHKLVPLVDPKYPDGLGASPDHVTQLCDTGAK